MRNHGFASRLYSSHAVSSLGRLGSRIGAGRVAKGGYRVRVSDAAGGPVRVCGPRGPNNSSRRPQRLDTRCSPATLAQACPGICALVRAEQSRSGRQSPSAFAGPSTVRPSHNQQHCRVWTFPCHLGQNYAYANSTGKCSSADSTGLPEVSSFRSRRIKHLPGRSLRRSLKFLISESLR